MSNYYVAKTYTDWPRETDPYEIGGRMYVKVRSPKGDIKQVRAYPLKEGALAPVQPSGIIAKAHIVKNILGFQEGYIWIFKGDTANAEYWFEKTPECRYHVVWGWYIVSTESVPANIPSCIQAVQLPWEKVGNTDGTLLPKDTIQSAVDELIYGGHPSQYQGVIGERLEVAATLTAIIDLGATQYGTSRMFCFVDANQNEYTWVTGVAKPWAIGDTLKLRGTVKNHEVYKNIKRTVLTRVMEVK